MVQPAPQPFSVVATASTSGWSGSGVTPVSGVSGIVGQYAGPHYVEEQSLNISYVRVPRGYSNSNTLKLNDASATYRIGATALACVVTANYSRKKVDAVFDTSSYQQSQKFQFLGVSADAEGNTYGDIDASTLGPAGDIVTSQPWYYRRPWDDTSDTEIVSSVTVATYAIAASGDDGSLTSYNQPEYTQFKWFFMAPGSPFSFLSLDDHYAYGYPYNSYTLYGPYNTDQESLTLIINFLDTMGSKLSTKRLYAIPANVDTQFGYSFLLEDSGLPEYSTVRHDYS